MWLRIEAELADERAVARQLERFGCRVIEESPTQLRVELTEAATERAAIVETRLYLGPWVRSVHSLQAA
jgi:hypothetical protein